MVKRKEENSLQVAKRISKDGNNFRRWMTHPELESAQRGKKKGKIIHYITI